MNKESFFVGVFCCVIVSVSVGFNAELSAFLHLLHLVICLCIVWLGDKKQHQNKMHVDLLTD